MTDSDHNLLPSDTTRSTVAFLNFPLKYMFLSGELCGRSSNKKEYGGVRFLEVDPPCPTDWCQSLGLFIGKPIVRKIPFCRTLVLNVADNRKENISLKNSIRHLIWERAYKLI